MQIYNALDEHRMYWKMSHMDTKISNKLTFTKDSLPSSSTFGQQVTYAIRVVLKDNGAIYCAPYCIAATYFIGNSRIRRQQLAGFFTHIPQLSKIEKILLYKYIMNDLKMYREKYKYLTLNKNLHNI